METTVPEEVSQGIEDLLSRLDPAHGDPGEFLGAQFDAGLAWVHYPVGLGGLALDATLQTHIDARIAAPSRMRAHARNPIGIGMAAPTLLAHGTAEQCRRYLRPIFTGAERWCQLFSEPGAGSDLASLSTRAVRDGDAWVVNGQKVWTTQADRARRGLLLARTDPTVAKHNGLSYFVVDMTEPGIDVRPLRQINNIAEFNEVFLDNVRVPDTDRIGAEGEGWKVATTTLSNERVALSGAGGGMATVGGSQLEKLLALAEAAGGWSDDALSARLVALYIESRLIRWTNLRARIARRNGAPGPEGSATKLFQGLHNRRLQETFVDVLASRATAFGVDDGAAQSIINGYLRAQANTIEGGTANIQRNVIGERILKLPKEPGPPRDQPWDQTPRN